MSPVRIRSPAPYSALPIAMIKRLVLLSVGSFLLSYTALAQDYKLEPISTAAPGLPAGFVPVIQGQGFRVNGAAGPWCEIWLAKAVPVGAKPEDAAISFGIAQ